MNKLQGTKQQNQPNTDLGIVKAIAGQGDAVEIVLPTSQADIDVAYDEALHALKTRPKILKAERTPGEKEVMKQDYYRSVRTSVLLFWLLTNGILAACILHGNPKGVFQLTKGTDSTTATAESVSDSIVARVYMVSSLLTFLLNAYPQLDCDFIICDFLGCCQTGFI